MTGRINGAGPQDTWDHVFGAGALTWDWWLASESRGVNGGDVEPDWQVTVTVGEPGDAETATVTHARLMTAARRVLRARPRYASDALVRECRNLVFEADAADFDAASGDELLQVAVLGEVVYG